MMFHPGLLEDAPRGAAGPYTPPSSKGKPLTQAKLTLGFGVGLIIGVGGSCNRLGSRPCLFLARGSCNRRLTVKSL